MTQWPSANERLRFLDTPVADAISVAVGVVGGISVASCTVFWLLTFTPWSVRSAATWVPSFALVFPFCFWALLGPGRALRSGSSLRRSSGTELAKILPVSWAAVVAFVFVVEWTIGLWSFATLANGSPGYDAKLHRYYLDNHGQRTWISHDAYVSAVMAQNRLFLGAAITFTLVAVAICWSSVLRRRTAGRPALWKHPTRPRPAMILPLPVWVFIAGVATFGCVALVSLIVTRIDTYNTTVHYLSTSKVKRLRLGVGDYVVFVGCLDSGSCGQLRPRDVQVVDAGTLRRVPTQRDPSKDDLTEHEQPFVGRVSLVVPRSALYAVKLLRRPGEPVFVTRSPGEEAVALAGWIAGAIGCLFFALVGALMLLRFASWRLGFGPQWHPPALPLAGVDAAKDDD